MDRIVLCFPDLQSIKEGYGDMLTRKVTYSQCGVLLRRLTRRHVYICAVMAIPSRTSQARMTTSLSMLGAECHGHSDVLFIAFGPSTRSIRICPNILGWLKPSSKPSSKPTFQDCIQ